MQAPYFPIIYVRGYAMTEGERDETAADPFCGFNLGSTVVCPHTPNHQQVRRVITPHIDLSHRLRRRVPEENRSSASCA